MSIRHKYIVCLFLIGSVLSSCTKKLPEDVIPPEKMEAVLYDYHIAQSMGNEYNGEDRYKRELLLQYVYDKYQITAAQFDSSLVWYARNTETLNDIYERLGKRFEQSSKQLQEQSVASVQTKEEPVSGDTVNVWRMNELYRLTTAHMTNKLLFTIPADTSYHQLDRFVWEFTALPASAHKDTLRLGEVVLSICYKNDSTVSLYQPLEEGKNLLALQADTLQMKELKGFIYFPGDTLSNEIQNLLIYNISLQRYHASEAELEEAIKKSKEAALSQQEAKDTLKPLEPVKDTLIPANTPTRLSPKELREQNRPARAPRKATPSASTQRRAVKQPPVRNNR